MDAAANLAKEHHDVMPSWHPATSLHRLLIHYHYFFRWMLVSDAGSDSMVKRDYFFILLRFVIVLFRYATMLPLNHGWWYGIGNWSLEKCMKWTIMTGLHQKPTSISRIRFYKHTRETFPAWIRIKILSCKSITKPREYEYDLINTASHLITVAEITRHGNGFSVLRYLNTHLLCQIAQGINVEEGLFANTRSTLCPGLVSLSVCSGPTEFRLPIHWLNSDSEELLYALATVATRITGSFTRG